ncbi:hypothetical protein D3C81_1701430 [compost metagenome]
MHGANARTREHGHGRLGHHRHVDDHPITLLHPQRAQQPGKARHFVAQFQEGEALLGRRDRRVVDERGLRPSALLDLMIEREITAVEAAINEPLVSAIVVGDQACGRLAVPGQRLGLLGPESRGVVDGARVTILIIHPVQP